MNESIDSYVLIVDDDSDDDAIGPEPNNHQPGSSSLHDLNFTLFELSNQSTVSWIKNCSNAFENIDLEDPRVLGSLVPLGIICLVVIFGNIMVIAAVKMTHKLRGATNLFIVSLAWADLMLGMVVLPFSAMYEVFDIWIFGRIWCSIWLAMDVWVCTASILHLVVISLDRYIAVTHPITYPNIMTSNRAKLLIVGAWVLSFVICFPPLVGWNDESSPAMWVPAEFTVANLVAQGGTNSSSSFHLNNNPDVLAILSRCMPQCKLIQEPGYVIYSAVGSFYAPMLVMMFFNWRIYRTAKKTTKAIRQGWTKVKVGGANAVGMGIHRGGGGAMSMANLTTIQNNAKTSRRSSMARPSNALNPSSRRPSASGIVLSSSTILSSGAGKPNHPAQASGSESNFRTLPRASKYKINSAGWPISLPRDDDQLSCTLNALHLSSPALRPNHNAKQISASSKSLLSVPTWDQKSQPLNKSSIAPNVSHHQPCPNHIMGKTFAEHGTQTLKEDKLYIWTNTQVGNGRLGRTGKREFFRWRSKSASQPGRHPSSRLGDAILDEISKPGSPTRSLDSVQQKHRRNVSSCFHIPRLKKPIILNQKIFKRQQNNHSDPPSPLMMSVPGSTDDLHHSRLSAHASNHGSVNNLTQNLIQQHTCGGSANKFGKRNIKNQVRRFRMETKAAKTLGIIVGCFICCWFPFFTMYLITAFCEDCFPELAFSIIFWMGYCNSAINPFIYAMFSREFRGAFKKILCKFLCNKNEPRGGALVRMGLPFAPQTVAIGLTDRFSPAVLTVGGGHLQNGHNGLNDNPSSSNSDSMKTKKITGKKNL